MDLHRSRLDSTWQNDTTGEVRHLVLVNLNGYEETELFQMSCGQATSHGIRSEYENGEKAQELEDAWAAEGFTLRDDPNKPVFQPLAHIVALAKLLGYEKVILPHPIMQMTPLEQWRGVEPKIGVTYEYALDGSQIIAQAVLPAHLTDATALKPSDLVGYREFLERLVNARKVAGPPYRFPLG